MRQWRPVRIHFRCIIKGDERWSSTLLLLAKKIAHLHSQVYRRSIQSNSETVSNCNNSQMHSFGTKSFLFLILTLDHTCVIIGVDRMQCCSCSSFLWPGVLSVSGSAASPTSGASAIQRLEASLAKVDSSPASSPDMSRSVSATFDCLRSTLGFHIS